MAAENSLYRDIVALIPALRRFATRFHQNPSDADDLVQETLLRGIAALQSFTPGTSLKSWLFTIMRNVHHTAYQRAKRMSVGTDDLEHLIPTASSPQEWAVRMHELDRALISMPSAYRDAYRFVIEDGLSYDLAAARCKVAIGTVKSRVNRARHFLASHMGESVSTAASI
jgi:RNA polymerase sigma-70 factor (ECF subfamily)